MDLQSIYQQVGKFSRWGWIGEERRGEDIRIVRKGVQADWYCNSDDDNHNHIHNNNNNNNKTNY